MIGCHICGHKGKWVDIVEKENRLDNKLNNNVSYTSFDSDLIMRSKSIKSVVTKNATNISNGYIIPIHMPVISESVTYP